MGRNGENSPVLDPTGREQGAQRIQKIISIITATITITSSPAAAREDVQSGSPNHCRHRPHHHHHTPPLQMQAHTGSSRASATIGAPKDPESDWISTLRKHHRCRSKPTEASLLTRRTRTCNNHRRRTMDCKSRPPAEYILGRIDSWSNVDVASSSESIKVKSSQVQSKKKKNLITFYTIG